MSDEAPESGRKANGQFASGNASGRGGGGFAVKALHFKSILMEAVTDEDMREIARVLIDGAKAGDKNLLPEFLNRLMGKPAQAIEVSGPEGGPQRITFTFEGEGKP